MFRPIFDRWVSELPVEHAAKVYAQRGYGKNMGFGKSPAVLVIDMQYAFVDPDSPSRVLPQILEIIPPIQRLLQSARNFGLPIFFTRGVVSKDRITEGLWRFKTKGHQLGVVQVEGTRSAEIIDELKPEPGEHVIVKRRPSAFFQTDLELFLRGYGVDTLLITGSSVSGCVRATVTDAFMRDIRPMVIRECVADRSPDVFENNLFDMQAKYADIVALEEVLRYLESVEVGSQVTS